MDGFDTYVAESVPTAGRTRRRLALYLGLAVLLAAASLVAVNSRGGEAAKVPRVLVPSAGSACNSTPGNGFGYTNTVDGTTMTVCISQEGNINQINFPDTAASHKQIAWDGYCLGDLDSNTLYNDYSPGSGVPFSGWGAATLTQTPPNQVNVTRSTLDGKYQLTEFIKINFQPRSIFVGMTIKNTDTVTHHFLFSRTVAPAIDNSAANDQYNQYGVGALLGVAQFGRTGLAFESAGPGTNALAFGPTQKDGLVYTATVSAFVASGGCIASSERGFQATGNRVMVGSIGDPTTGDYKHFTLAPNASVNVGKFVYRML